MDDPEYTSEVEMTTQEILLLASKHDLEAMKPYLRVPGAASVQDAETGMTPLHAAVAACGSIQVDRQSGDQLSSGVLGHPLHEGQVAEDEVDLEKAKQVVNELLLSGAIWNDLDKANETPGCLAWRLGHKELYELIVQAGVRAELLLNMMGDYERLSDEDDDEDDLADNAKDNVAQEKPRNGNPEAGEDQVTDDIGNEEVMTQETSNTESIPNPGDEITSTTYLTKPLTFPSPMTILDASSNGVMMAWESSIMARTVSLLYPSSGPELSDSRCGPRVLNIGFGLGIIDTLFAELDPPPRSHHIIEAHPSILSLLSQPSSTLSPNSPDAFRTFGPSWRQNQSSHYLHAGRWQDVLPLITAPPPGSPWLDDEDQPPQFDAIFFDTFAEDYSALKEFFTEYVPALLAEGGKMSFFMGCGADRRVCYDVYKRVVECDLASAGLDVAWSEVDVEREVWGKGLDGDESGASGLWRGVRRRYFDIDIYYLPICEFMR